jgi:hypothetical protein
VTRARRRALVTVTLAWIAASALPVSAQPPAVTWHGVPRLGEVAWIHVREVPPGAEIHGHVGGRPLTFFTYGGGVAALVGFDLETAPGRQPWRVALLAPGRPPRVASGTADVRPRSFPIQRLTLPAPMVDLDPATERRAVAEAGQLRILSRMITAERLWRGRFTPPIASPEPGSGFGARRVINGKPRAPHSGADFAAPRGTPIVAPNDGRVALIAEHFFPGRLVAIDHGLGLYTLYFHLDAVSVAEGERVTRGQPIAAVGATGRATGPHLHFAVLAGTARVDPAALLALTID